MKSLLTALLALSFHISLSQGLIGNGSFENFNQCPGSYNQVPYATGWMQSLTNNVGPYHAEYMHGCNNGNFSIPSNVWGTQMPSSGQGYVAIAMKAPVVAADYRENVYTALTTPLVAGHVYHASFKVSHCELARYCSNNMGMKFSTGTAFLINNQSQIHSTNVITDETGWQTIQGEFVADSAYSYVAIGNFYTDAQTNDSLAYPSNTVDYPAYYFDEISVTDITGINELLHNSMSYNLSVTDNGPGIYDQLINLGVKEVADCTLKIYNNSGALIFESSRVNNQSWNGNSGGRSVQGIYYYQLISNDKQYKGRILVQ